MPRIRSLLRLLVPAVVLAAALVGCTSFDEQQRKWIFQASTGSSPWRGDVDGMADVWIEHRSAVSGKPVRLHALWLPQERGDAPLLLYLHGARRNVADSSFRIRNMHELGFAVLAVDYRGFGLAARNCPRKPACWKTPAPCGTGSAANMPARRATSSAIRSAAPSRWNSRARWAIRTA